MKLEKIIINGYGKINDLKVDFTDGLNIVFGPNESGKSTLQAFIKAMLYGQKKGKTDGFIEKDRYRPWNGGPYGGFLEYTLDDLNRFRVWRDFSTGQVKVFNSNLNEITDTFSCSRVNGVLFAEEHLGIDQELFVRTSFVSQLGVRTNIEGERLLSDRIANIIESGSERTSYEDAKRILEKTLIEEVGTERTTGKPLDRIKENIKKLESEKNKCEDILERILKLETHLKSLREEQRRLDIQTKYIKMVKDAKQVQIKYNQAKKENDGIIDLEYELEVKMQELDELNSKIPDGVSIFDDEVSNSLLSIQSQIKESAGRKKNIVRYAGITLALVGAAIIVSIPKFWMLGILISSVGFTGMLMFDSIRKIIGIKNDSFYTCRNITELEDELQDILSTAGVESIYHYFEKKKDISFAAEKKEFLIKSIDLIKEQVSRLKKYNQDLSEAEKKQEQKNREIQNILDQSSEERIALSEDLIHKSPEEIEEYYEVTVEKLREVQFEIRELETEIRVLSKEIDRLPSIEEELVLARIRKNELEELDYCIRKALEVMEECSNQLKSDIGPYIARRASQITRSITNRYNDITTKADGTKLSVSMADGNIVNVCQLSGGTIDQVYLALRMAVAELISSNREALPLIFDEVFSLYDDNRLYLGAHCLREISEDKQIILFTCREQEVGVMSKVIPQVNLIRLGID